jgi:hypothetical protein
MNFIKTNMTFLHVFVVLCFGVIRYVSKTIIYCVFDFMRSKQLKKRTSTYELKLIFYKVLKALNQNGEFYWKYTTRHNRSSEDFKPQREVAECNNKLPKIAIVIQGPIMQENNFTLETVLLYKKFFSSADIIVSTWENEDTRKIAEIDGVYLIKSQLPSHPGNGNVNYQIMSTKYGIEKAKELNSEFVLKSRADQRIYNWQILNYFVNLLKTFPTACKDKQVNRIIITNVFSYVYCPFFFSDLFMFGSTMDLEKFWDCELDPRDKNALGFWTAAENNLEFFKLNYAEIFLHKTYSKKLQTNGTCELEKSINYLRDSLCVVDMHTMGLFWPKYRYRYYEPIGSGNFLNLENTLSFPLWLNIYNQDIFIDYAYYEKQPVKPSDIIVLDDSRW